MKLFGGNNKNCAGYWNLKTNNWGAEMISSRKYWYPKLIKANNKVITNFSWRRLKPWKWAYQRVSDNIFYNLEILIRDLIGIEWTINLDKCSVFNNIYMQSNEDLVDALLDGIEKGSSREAFSAGMDILAKLIHK